MNKSLEDTKREGQKEFEATHGWRFSDPLEQSLQRDTENFMDLFAEKVWEAAYKQGKEDAYAVGPGELTKD